VATSLCIFLHLLLAREILESFTVLSSGLLLLFMFSKIVKNKIPKQKKNKQIILDVAQHYADSNKQVLTGLKDQYLTQTQLSRHKKKGAVNK
jgi:hypothetical protein